MTLWLTNAGHKRSQVYRSESFSHVRWSAMWAPPWNAIPELYGALRGHVICPMSADSHRLRNWRWAKSRRWHSKSWNCTSNFGLRVHQSRWEGRKLGNYGTLDPHIEENIVFLENSEITAMATFSNFARTPQVLWLLRLLEQNWSQMSCRHMAPCPVPPVARAAAPPDQLDRRKAPCRQGHGARGSRRHVAGNFVSKQRMRFWCFLRFLRFRWQNRYPCIAVIVTWLSFWPLLSSTRLLLQSCAPKVLCAKHDPERSCFCCPGMTWLACGHSPQKASKSKEEWLEDLKNDFVISCPSMASGSRPVVCSAFWTAWRRPPFAAPVMAPPAGATDLKPGIVLPRTLSGGTRSGQGEGGEPCWTVMNRGEHGEIESYFNHLFAVSLRWWGKVPKQFRGGAADLQIIPRLRRLRPHCSSFYLGWLMRSYNSQMFVHESVDMAVDSNFTVRRASITSASSVMSCFRTAATAAK